MKQTPQLWPMKCGRLSSYAMNQHINALLGPLEAATRQGSWEDAEDIAREISRLARLERLKVLQSVQEALEARRIRQSLSPHPKHPLIAPRGSQVAKTPIPGQSPAPIRQGESTSARLIPSAPACPEPFESEQWPFG